jgi:hypothetical protein
MIEDTRKELQRKELQSFLTEWVRRGKITGYVRYAKAIGKWLGLITNGSPLTAYEEATEDDYASIKELTDIIISSHVDVRVLEQLRDLYVEIGSRYVDQSKRNAKFWDRLSKDLNQSLRQFKAHSSIGAGSTTYVPMVSDPEIQLNNLSMDTNRGIHLPGHGDVIVQEPNDITLTTYPSHNPHGGVTLQNPEFVDSTQDIRKLFKGAGIEQWAWTSEVPHIVIDNITYPGVVWEIELHYQGSITFTSLLINLRGKYPTTLCNIYTKNLDSEAWALVTDLDGNWDHVTGTEFIEVNDFNRTTARKVRIRLCQENYEIRNQDINNYARDGAKKEDLTWIEGNQSVNRVESNIYDDSLTELETGSKLKSIPPGQFLYQIGLASIKFNYDSYLANGNGDMWSHTTEENKGFKLPSQPTEIVTIVPEQKTPEISTVEWWVEDITRRFQMPILPKGTTRYREPINFVDQFTAQLTFPIAATTTPVIYLNGNAVTPGNVREINSTEIDLGAIAVNRTDNYVIEYDIAVGQIVMGYIFVNDTETTRTLSGSNTDANSIYVNKAQADAWLVANSYQNEIHSVPVMIRLDEYFYWFNNGEQVYNLGNLTTKVPRVYVAPEL